MTKTTGASLSISCEQSCPKPERCFHTGAGTQLWKLSPTGYHVPLRDHFPPPLDDIASWEELHGQWPATIVHQLRKKLPSGYLAGPRVHAGSQVEIEVAAYEKEHANSNFNILGGNGGAAMVWAPAAPTVAVETDLPD